MTDEDLDLCACTSRKIWSVKETAGLVEAWSETLDQVNFSRLLLKFEIII